MSTDHHLPTAAEAPRPHCIPSRFDTRPGSRPDGPERRTTRWPQRLGRVLSAAALAALLPLALPVAAVAQPATAQPNPRLPQVQIQAGMHIIRAEVAADSATRTRGLMMRERLGTNEGMLFVFPERAIHCFWMRNTLIPLSIAFIDDDGTIAGIADMEALSEDSHCPPRAVRYALEMERGWFARRGIAPGAQLAEPGFFGPPRR
jgi:uncharacterized protein